MTSSKTALVLLLLVVAAAVRPSEETEIFRRDIIENVQDWARQLPAKFDEAVTSLKDSLNTTFQDLSKRIQAMRDESGVDAVIENAQASLSASIDSMVKEGQQLMESNNITADEIAQRAAQIQDQITKTADEYAQQMKQFGQDVSAKFSDLAVADRFQEAAKDIQKRAEEATKYVSEEAAKLFASTPAPPKVNNN